LETAAESVKGEASKSKHDLPVSVHHFRPVWWHYLKALLGPPSQRRLGRAALGIDKMRYWEEQFSGLSDAEVLLTAQRLRGRTRGGEPLHKLIPEVFGLVCIASGRIGKMRPFDVQLAAGVVMHFGGLAELATGEGKTLTAVLPASLNALLGKGVHVTTVNDYLARRDAEWLGPVYRYLGLSVGALQQQLGDAERAKIYRCDITYGTASEFGFDFLRDRLKLIGSKGNEQPFWAPWLGSGQNGEAPADPCAQREHHFAIVDEADNIFIDEAKTPLIIAMATRHATQEESEVYHWADSLARQMGIHTHFTFDEKKQKLELNDNGRTLVRWSNPPIGKHSHAMDKLQEHIERALHAHYRFRRDQHYMIDKEKVVLIDESTGRPQPDRHWRDGLHQAVEAKEGVPVNMPSDHAAQITYQSYFRLYTKLAGMTGTAAQNWLELRRVYKLWVVCVPTNRRVRRDVLPDRIFPTEDAKFDAVVEEVKRIRALGRAVLIGTRSVDKSEKLSERLHQANIAHQVLNAKFHEQEAKIVEQAGQPQRVTIATNMAGRGTDIKLGPGVAEAGGLAVIGTERHEARRIDRQLAGRAARQGDPGSAQFFLCLEDELLESLGPDKYERLKQLGRSGGQNDWQSYAPLFLRAQRRAERKNYRQRVDLMVREKQRQEILKDLGADPYVD
jgi:preprotein translocase subunit SecA